jgi:hypothetical protein
MSKTILFTIGDYDIIKERLDGLDGLPAEYDELNEHIAETLQTDNIKLYLTTLLKMENVISGRPFDEELRITDVEIVQRLNISRNGDKLRDWIEKCKNNPDGKICKKINLFAKNMLFTDRQIDLLKKLEPLCREVRPYRDEVITLERGYEKSLDKIDDDEKEESRPGKPTRRLPQMVAIGLGIFLVLAIIAPKTEKNAKEMKDTNKTTKEYLQNR